MSRSIFLRAATRAKLPKRTTISFNDACRFIEAFVTGSQRCYATRKVTHSASNVPPGSDLPPSHRPYYSRGHLLHRTYISLLRATPLLVMFQHNNLRAGELVSIRRDLRTAMANVDAMVAASRPPPQPTEDGTITPQPRPVGEQVKMTILNTTVFKAALRSAEYLPKDADVRSSSSPEAYDMTLQYDNAHSLSPLMVGPTGVIQFPTVSPPHLLGVLNLLFPEKFTFRKGTDPAFISGVQKLLLLGAKVDKVGGTTIDTESLKHITTLGDLTTLQGQLLGIMQSAGGSLVSTLQSPARGLWSVMDGRRKMLDPDHGKSSEEEAPAEGPAEAPAA
ncbi:hypothetical protein Dda_5922 [Drechslerella dactyloides]|uniref:Uncharacterized protein n=1 Tax=Drechslerella dactyloides TaxID=74499 RepID=A0AAD6IV72_DREDA|nr:hypothetical protein Dda_5922 [Drechslerella dactyloides]